MPRTRSRASAAVLEALKKNFGNNDAQLLRTLRKVAKPKDSDSLVRLHEALLFIRAYPPSAKALKQIEAILGSFHQWVSQLHEANIDLSPLDDPEVSGIAGASVTSNFSYAIVCWLAMKYAKQVSIDWDWFESEDTFGSTMTRFLPLLGEDALVEAHVPYRDWLRRAAGPRNEVVWLIERFRNLLLLESEKARIYDSLKLHMRWQFGDAASRTSMKLPRRRIFFHRTPLIQRRDVSLSAELAAPPIAIEKLSARSGEKIIDLARATSAVRYRELHGFTYGDRRNVLKADLGRGTEAYVTSVSAEHRLPLRAYHAALIFKNGIPEAYFEGLSLFERIESGFNLYYTFREGETAWLFARILRLMRQLLGVTVISIDPYQIGHENEEGIESGAFWFYRKLGFRPVRPELLKLTRTEEEKIRRNPNYRTSARTLRRLAAGHMLFDISRSDESDWDRFQVRNIGFAVQRRMSRDFGGDADRLNRAAIKFLKTLLESEITTPLESPGMKDFASVLMLIPDLPHWTHDEKRLLARILEAKARQSESLYLRLSQRHERLRAAIIRLGSTR